MSAGDFKKSIAGGVVAPLYFFCGGNAPEMEEALGALRAALFPAGPAELDIRQLDAQSHGPADILEAARTQSFFSSRKLVIVRQAHALKQAHWDRLKDYCKKPSPTCCIVFILPLDDREKKDRAQIESLKKKGAVFSFQNPRGDRQIMQYAKAGLAERGLAVAPDALAYLGAVLGEDAQAIAGEIEKLALYCGGRGAVTAADIDAVVCGGGKGTIFNFVDAACAGKTAEALKLLCGMLDSGVHGLVVLKMLARQFRLIHSARLMLDRGEPAGRIAQRLRLPEFVVKGIVQQARGWPAGRMGMVFEELFQASMLSRSSRADSRLVLECLLLRLPELRA